MAFYDFLFEISTPVLFLLSIAAMLTLCVLATLLTQGTQRMWPSRQGAAMVNTMLSGLITPAALTIVFLSNEVWSEAGKAQAATDKEGIAVVESLRLVRHLPEAEQAQVRTALLDYGTAVVNDDWRAMDHRGSSEKADDALFTLRKVLYEARLRAAGAPSPALDALTQNSNTIAEAKEMRRIIATHHVSSIKWLTMIALLFVSAGTLAELHRNHRRERVTALILFSIAFGSICFLILMHDRPFAGVTAIRPDIIERALKAM